MRFALVSELEIDSGKRRCGMRRPHGQRSGEAEPADAKSHIAAVRVSDDAEPADAKSRIVAARVSDEEPSDAAKGERGTTTPGEIRC